MKLEWMRNYIPQLVNWERPLCDGHKWTLRRSCVADGEYHLTETLLTAIIPSFVINKLLFRFRFGPHQTVHFLSGFVLWYTNPQNSILKSYRHTWIFANKQDHKTYVYSSLLHRMITSQNGIVWDPKHRIQSCTFNPQCYILQLHMMPSSNGNIFRGTGPLCGEFTGHRWIPLTKASDAELWCFLWCAPE